MLSTITLKKELKMTQRLCFFLFALISFAVAQDTSIPEKKQPGISGLDTLAEVGSWTFGYHRELAVDRSRDIAFLNSGGTVLILDISTISSPVLLNDSIQTAGVAKDIYYDSTTQNLYVSMDENGIEIWDAQSINSPQLLGSLLLNYAGTTPPATQIAVKPGFIFVAAEYAGVITVNVSDPANPYQSSYNLGFGDDKYSLALSEDGNYLVATSLDRTDLYGVNADGSLTLIDTSAPLYGGDEVHIVGNYCYEINNGTIYVLDLNGIGLPFVSSFTLPGNATSGYDMVNVNNTLYLTDPFYGVEIFDISNPFNLILLGSYQTPCKDISYFSGYALVSDGAGMKILDVSDPANPLLAGSYEGIGGVIRDVAVFGSYCYLHTFFNFFIIDVSDPTSPVLAGSNEPSSGFDRKFVINGDYAYITNSEVGIRVVDITNPGNPITVGSNGSASYSRIASEGNYLYATDTQYNLNILDISNPISPVQMSSLAFPDITGEIAVSNGYVYLAQYDDGLKIVDVSNPSQPTLASEYTQNVYVTDVAVQGDYAYVPDYYQFYTRVLIFDISDPLTPSIVGEQVFDDPPPHARDNFIYENVLFVTEQTYPYLTWIDVTDPTQPFEISNQMIPDICYALDIAEDYLYVATENAGLHIYENPVVTAVDDEGEPIVPKVFALSQNYPNPFNPETKISFKIPHASDVTLKIYNLLGQKIKTLVDGFLSAGNYDYSWNGTDDQGNDVVSGIYFYELRTNELSQVRKMVLTK